MLPRGLRVAADGDEQGAFELNEGLIGAEPCMGLAEPSGKGLAGCAVERLDLLDRRGQVAFVERRLGASSMRLIVTNDCALAISVSTSEPLEAGAVATCAPSLATTNERARSGTVGMPFSA